MADREALYIISVAARLVEMHPSTLRKYERIGFLEPSRLGGKLRLYSAEDIERLRQIKYLVEERGINLAGIELALELTYGLLQLRAELRQVERASAEPERRGPGTGLDGTESQSERVGQAERRARDARRMRQLAEQLLRSLGVEADVVDEAGTSRAPTAGSRPQQGRTHSGGYHA